MSQPVTDPATQQALAEMCQLAREQMHWEAGFIQRYCKKQASIEFVKMHSCTEITIQAHEEHAAAYRLVAEDLRITLPNNCDPVTAALPLPALNGALATRLQDALNTAHESATTVLGYNRLTAAVEEVIRELSQPAAPLDKAAACLYELADILSATHPEWAGNIRWATNNLTR